MSETNGIIGRRSLAEGSRAQAGGGGFPLLLGRGPRVNETLPRLLELLPQWVS